MRTVAGLFRPRMNCALSADAAAAISKADAAISTLDEAIGESRSLTEKLQQIYADKGRDGFDAFVSDVYLAEQLSRAHDGPPQPIKQ